MKKTKPVNKIIFDRNVDADIRQALNLPPGKTALAYIKDPLSPKTIEITSLSELVLKVK